LRKSRKRGVNTKNVIHGGSPW